METWIEKDSDGARERAVDAIFRLEVMEHE